MIVTTQGRIDGRIHDYNKTYSAHGDNILAVPLVILIDAETASSAEMVAGALQENQRGQLVGQPTFGKASIQRIDKLKSAPLAGLRMTVARFYSPTGRAYGDTGVTPQVVIRSEVSTEIGQDAQLQAALDLARPLTMGAKEPAASTGRRADGSERAAAESYTRLEDRGHQRRSQPQPNHLHDLSQRSRAEL